MYRNPIQVGLELYITNRFLRIENVLSDVVYLFYRRLTLTLALTSLPTTCVGPSRSLYTGLSLTLVTRYQARSIAVEGDCVERAHSLPSLISIFLHADGVSAFPFSVNFDLSRGRLNVTSCEGVGLVLMYNVYS